MVANTAQRRNLIRALYRDHASPNARREALQKLADYATAQQGSGKTLVQANGEGFASQYLAFTGWEPNDVAELVDWAHDYVSEVDTPATDTTPAVAAVDAALARVGHAIKFVRGSYLAFGYPYQ